MPPVKRQSLSDILRTADWPALEAIINRLDEMEREISRMQAYEAAIRNAAYWTCNFGPMETFLALLTAHLLADLVFQIRWMAREKERSAIMKAGIEHWMLALR